mgnify:CR=1 FL=1
MKRIAGKVTDKLANKLGHNFDPNPDEVIATTIGNTVKSTISPAKLDQNLIAYGEALKAEMFWGKQRMLNLRQVNKRPSFAQPVFDKKASDLTNELTQFLKQATDKLIETSFDLTVCICFYPVNDIQRKEFDMNRLLNLHAIKRVKTIASELQLFINANFVTLKPFQVKGAEEALKKCKQAMERAIRIERLAKHKTNPKINKSKPS